MKRDGNQQKLDFRGGCRPGSGPKKIGDTRRFSITLPGDIWAAFDERCKVENETAAAMMRKIIICEADFSSVNKKCDPDHKKRRTRN